MVSTWTPRRAAYLVIIMTITPLPASDLTFQRHYTFLPAISIELLLQQLFLSFSDKTMKTWIKIFDIDHSIIDTLDDPRAISNASAEPEEAGIDLEMPERKTCRLCVMFFDTLAEQREHFKSPQHIEHLQQAAGSSEDDDEWETSEDEEDKDIHHLPVVRFRSTQENVQFLAYRSVFDEAESSLTRTQLFKAFLAKSDLKWAIFMLSGGHFAGMIFDLRAWKVIQHKTFHRYTTRRKQGGSQRSQDSTGRKPKSAGASIRRQNEAKLEEEVQQLLRGWNGALATCHRIFVFAPGQYNKQIIYGTDALSRNNVHVRSIPFTVSKPTLAELQAICDRLMTVQLVET